MLVELEFRGGLRRLKDGRCWGPRRLCCIVSTLLQSSAMLTDRILAYLLIVKLMVFLTAKAGRKYIHYLAQIPHVLIEDCEAQERGM